MPKRGDIKRYKENLKAEQEAIMLYSRLAEAEKNPDLAAIYLKLVETEKKHAEFWRTKLREAGSDSPRFRPGWRTRIFGWLAAKMGPSFVLPSIAAMESTAASGYDDQYDAGSVHMPADERSHARIFNYLARTSQGLEGREVARFEGRHRATAGNALRAAVLGANDGLVSVF